MARAGRTSKLKPEVERQLLTLYCQRLSPVEFVFSLDEIAAVLDIDVRTAKRVLRDTTVPLIEDFLTRSKS